MTGVFAFVVAIRRHNWRPRTSHGRTHQGGFVARASFHRRQPPVPSISEVIDLRVKNLVLDTSPAVHLTGKGRKQRFMRRSHGHSVT